MMTIRRRLIVGFLVGFGLLLTGGAAVVYWSTERALMRQLDARLRVEALSVVKQTVEEDGGIEVNFTDRYMPEFGDHGLEFYQVWDSAGVVVERSESLHTSDLPKRAGTVQAPTFWNITLPGGGQGRAIGMGFTVPAEREHRRQRRRTTATVTVASDTHQLRETADTLRGVLFAVGGVGVLLTVGLVSIVVRRGLAPLDRLADDADGITATSLKRRFPREAMPGELQPICARLNELLGRLDDSFQRERRFTSDVAHELRTPIAALRTISEVGLRWSQGLDQQATTDVLATAIGMERMVTQLLALARAENAAIPLTIEPIRLTELVETVWLPLSAESALKRLSTEFTISPSAIIHSDPVLLRGIITNLIVNAVDYTPPDGVLRVEYVEQAAHFELSISNTVDDLPPDDLPKLFRRFWRRDPARSDESHAGLGLALAKAFSALLGLELTADLKDERQLTLRVSGPILAEPFARKLSASS